MADVNPARRGYRSALRERQAAATREAVLTAARELFVAQGYGATTVDEIARRAGVSKPTVFSAVGNKQEVLAALCTIALGDGDEALTGAEPGPSARVVGELDARRALELEVEHLADGWSRYAEVREVLRGAASSGEPALQELWLAAERQRRTAARRLVDVLAGKGPLRDDLDRAAAADIVWLLSAADNYRALVSERGWTRAHYERWLTDVLTHALLPSPRGTSTSARARYSTSRTRSRRAP
jgi:AcrR family transcriptional regulator